MNGILGDYIEAKANPARFVAVWPDELVKTLDEAQCDALMYALLRKSGIEREDFDAFTKLGAQKLVADVRRDQARERIWQIETEIVSRLWDEVQAHMKREPRKSTGETYAADQKRFVRFCESLGVPSLPASAGAIAAFILAEHDAGVRWIQIRARLSAVKAWHHERGYLVPMRDRLVRVVIEHVRREGGRKEGAKDNG
jgi:hypothetical protein